MIRSAVRAAVVATCGVLVLGVAVPSSLAADVTLSRDYGPVGTVVTIAGTGVKDATHVTFGGGDAGAPTPVDDTHVQATVPSTAKTGAVVVTAADGTTKLDGGTFTVQRPTTAALSMSRTSPHVLTPWSRRSTSSSRICVWGSSRRK